MLNKSFFISKSLDQLPELAVWAHQHNFKVTSHSFLSFEAIPFVLDDKFDVVFFSSPRSFDFYLQQYPILKDVQIACAGLSTKKHIENKGFEVNYYSESAGNIDEATKAFEEWLNPLSIVLFPLSNLSKKSYSKYLSSHQVIEKMVYRTSVLPKIIPNCAIYIFTSPSNVEGFFKTNTLPDKALTIAWGNSTSKTLSTYANVDVVLNQSTIQELIQYLEKFLINT